MNTTNTDSKDEKTTTIQSVFRILLGITLIYTGISHLTFARAEFQAQVPKWVPLDADIVVLLSGIAEVVLGGALIVLRKYQMFVGWMTAAFFLLVFPGNIAQYINRVDAFGMNSDQARFIRLFFQPLLIIWAIWSTGAWTWWRKRRNKEENPSA